MDKYCVDKVVGEGSFGKALLCRRKSDQRKCIIKQISLKKMSRKEAAQTEQESQLLARLKHPNIVTFWESFSEPSKGVSYLWIVMDFADGGDLDHMIKARHGRLMQENQAMQLFVQIALAMKHVHDRKILHRDLKTQNIFLTKSGIVKLGDFGIARVLRNTGELASTQIGTPYYMSPEIMNNKRYNSKTDIWSLGCVLYELLTLKVPFEGNSMPQLVRNIIGGQYRPISPQYSQPVRDLVKAMLMKNPTDRPGINAILSQAVVRNIISNFLDQNERQNEFSHTVLHGEHILKKAPLPVDSVAPSPLQAAPAPAVPVPVAAPTAANPPSRVQAAPAPLPNSREQPGHSEIERLRAEAEKMRLKMEQMARERCAAVDAERKRLAALREKERLEVHRMQMEREAREKARQEEKAKKIKEYEQRKAAEAARVIREARDAADRRRAERDRPWAQPQLGPSKQPIAVVGAVAPKRAAPAWRNEVPPRKPIAQSPSNAVREASPAPRNELDDDSDQYMQKLRERLKQKDDDRRREKQAELSKLREKEKRDREDREKARQDHAQEEKERLRAKERRMLEQNMIEKQNKEKLESRLRDERIAERRRQEEIRAEKERLKELAAEARMAEKKRIAAENLAAEKDRLRAEKDKLAKRLEDREKERERRELERQARLNGAKPASSPRDSTPSAAPFHAKACNVRSDKDSDSSEDGGHAGKVTPDPSAGRYVLNPTPESNNKRGGGLNLEWLSHLEDEMGQLKGEMEKLSPHVRGGGVGSQSPSVRGNIPSSGEKGNLQFFKKNDRPKLANKGSTPHVAVPSPRVPLSEKGVIGKNYPSSAKSPRRPLKDRSASDLAGPSAAAGRGTKKPVAMSVDDLADIPPWRKKPSRATKAPSKKQVPPPSLVEESCSVISLDDRREKREKDRADFKKFLMEKRNVKPVQSDVVQKKPIQVVKPNNCKAVFQQFKVRKPNPEWVSDLPEPDDTEVDVIELPEEPKSIENNAMPSAVAVSLDTGLSITIENNNTIRETPPSTAESTSVKSPNRKQNAIANSGEKKQRLGLSKIIANIFGPRKKVIPGVSPKVRLQSPKIKIISPKLIAKAKSPKHSGAPVWMKKEFDVLESDKVNEDTVTDIEGDPYAWSSEVMFGDYADYNLATGPLPNGDNAASSSEYQEMLDSMRLVLQDAHAHPGPSVALNVNGKGGKMEAIKEESTPSKHHADRDGKNGNIELSDDDTFEESSVSLSVSESDEEVNSDWSVDTSGDEEEVADVAISELKNRARGAKPLGHFVSKEERRNKQSNDLKNDFCMESVSEKHAYESPGMKSTLYGVPISLSTSMKKDMAALSSYGPSVRIETLRIVLEDRLGEGPFLSAYKYLKGVKDRVPLEDEAAEDAEEERLLEDIERILGTGGLRYVDLLYELIAAEENF